MYREANRRVVDSLAKNGICNIFGGQNFYCELSMIESASFLIQSYLTQKKKKILQVVELMMEEFHRAIGWFYIQKHFSPCNMISLITSCC